MAPIVGTNGPDYLTGTYQNDRILGKSGDDYLYGDSGNDKLLGDVGDDYLVGSYGNDVLTGGAGADTFAFYDVYEGVDTIADYNAFQDVIEIYTSGFGGASPDQFTYDSDTGGLFHDSTQFATLQPNLDFDPSTDISFI